MGGDKYWVVFLFFNEEGLVVFFWLSCHLVTRCRHNVVEGRTEYSFKEESSLTIASVILS